MEDQDKVVNAKEFKKNKKLKKDKAVNDIIGKLSLLHKKADDGLKELVEMCHCSEEKDG
jgi:hypothetical protein